MELTRLKKRLVTARRGHKLLKDKRDELMRQFLDLVRENKVLRERVEYGIAEANKSFVVARSVMQDETIDTALLLPSYQMSLEVGTKNVMSVDIPTFKAKGKSAGASDIFSYSFAFTSGDLDSAVEELSGLLPEMIRLAEAEKSAQMLAAEIEKTRRRVNALEHVMIPQYEQTIKMIAMKLEENERSATARLMKVKDMMLEKVMEAKKSS
jgi:V/A-type H+-transporting ATPase subunit D